MGAWNGWYHVNGNTFGTWLRGDPHGWRARHHREHVEGDYKHPPPAGMYDRLLAHSKRLMQRDEVRLSEPARQLACREMVASLLRHRVEVIAVSVDDHHFHLLARFPLAASPSAALSRPQAHGSASEKPPTAEQPAACSNRLSIQTNLIRGLDGVMSARKDGDTALALIRHLIGIAKKDSAQVLTQAKLVDSGGVWAKRCRALGLRGREHQLNVFSYIVRHGDHGAATWTFRDPPPKSLWRPHGL